MGKRKIIALLTAVAVLSVSVLSGCSKKAQTTTTSSANKEVRMLTGVTGGKDDAEMKLWVAALEKATGLKLSLIHI